ncbi:MAG: DUF748 domain-containing protein [Cyclobacteriaceae bacterium]|nr:DUF748 domain-containing protein [Cyclobacteriaceae bacterium]
MKWKRWIKIGIVAFVLFLAVAFFIVPPIAKNYLLSHSKEWIGRKIAIENVGFNVFNGGVSLGGFIVFEEDDITVFTSFETLYVNVELLKALLGEYEVTEVTLSKPYISIIQKGDSFNFSDLERKFSTDSLPQESSAVNEPVKFWVRNLTLKEGIISYRNLDVASDIVLEGIHVASPLFAWNEPQLHYDLSFRMKQGGKAKGTFDFNLVSLDYKTNYSLDSLNLSILLPYVKDYMQVSSFRGIFSTHQNLSGNFNKPEAVATKGDLRLNDFALIDIDQGDLITLSEAEAIIDTLNVEAELYDMKYIRLSKPFIKFELFENGNNFTRLLNQVSDEEGISSDSLSTAVAYGNIFGLMAAYIQDISKTYAISNYKADSLVLRQGKFIFNDFTLHSKFNYVLEDLMIKAEGVSSANENIVFKATSILNTSGKMAGEISVNPDGFNDMDIHYTINDLKVFDFNPYSNYYVAHPFTDGICYYASTTSIKNRYLKSTNKLEIKTIYVGKKEKNSTAYNLPVRLAVALLRDKNGDVQLELPIEGNLDDPKYKIGKVIWQVLKNLVGKAVAAPGKLLAKKSGIDEKLLDGFAYQSLQTELTDDQKKSLDAMQASLQSTPEIKLELIKAFNFQRELDELALHESKKKFLFFNRKISTDDKVTEEEERLVEELHPQDSAFMAFVEHQSQTQNLLLSIFEKSKRLVGNEKLQSKLNAILEQRLAALTTYLEEKEFDFARVRIVDPQETKEIPYEVLSQLVANFYLDD